MARSSRVCRAQSDSDTESNTAVAHQLENLSIADDNSHSSTDSKSTSLPYLSWKHGNDIVHIDVGSGEDADTFTVHRELLVRSSVYFEKALCSQPSEPGPTLTLPDHCSDAFEVVYQYFYTGCVHDEDFYLFDVDGEVFWLRAYRIAIFISLHDLASSIYDIFITKQFSSKTDFTPSADFIHELFSGARPKGIIQLQTFIIEKTAYNIMCVKNAEWSASDWHDVFTHEPSFTTKVMQRISRLKSKAVGTTTKHPTNDSRYMTYRGRSVAIGKTDKGKGKAREQDTPEPSRSRSSTVSAGRA